MTLEFDVLGRPTPQGSKRAFVRNGRANLVEVAGQSLKDWRAVVSASATQAMENRNWYRISTPFEVVIRFRLPRPKSRPEADWHTVRPDLDKLTRAVLDSLTDAGIWADDALVARLVVSKTYARSPEAPGAYIHVSTIP